MQPLPAHAYEPSVWLSPKVGYDYLVSDGLNKYSVPYDLIGKKVEISLPKWIQSHKSETALKPLEIRHFTAFAPSSAALGEGRFSVLCG